MPSTRPQTHVQRDRCDRAHSDIIAVPNLHPAVHGTLVNDFILARDEYYAHFGEHAATKAVLARRIQELETARAACLVAFRQWVATITDAAGMHDAAALSVHFRGALPGEIPAMSNAEIVNRTANVHLTAAADPTIAGDAAKLEAFLAARAGLAAALTAREKIASGQTDSVGALAELERQYDGAWGQVVRVVVRRAPHLVNKIPVFHENTPADDDVILPDDAGTEEAEDEAAAGAGPTTETPPPGTSGEGKPPPTDADPSTETL